MIIWNWGKKRREVVVDERQRIVVVYSFFGLMFVLTVAWGAKYILAQWTEQGWATAPITKEQATMINHGITPDIHWWWKWSLLIAIGAPILFGLFVALFSL